jgi:hypothetical protein
MRGITWTGESIDDVEIVAALPRDLRELLLGNNGFILHEGALHVRGAVVAPEWHSLRTAWQGPQAFTRLYPLVRPGDIPFAQDQVGDQYLLREGAVFRLCGETGDVSSHAGSLAEFLRRADEDIEGFLNVALDRPMEPGQLLLAYPPFIFEDSGEGTAMRAVPAEEVIGFHAELARQMRDVPDGERVTFRLGE